MQNLVVYCSNTILHLISDCLPASNPEPLSGPGADMASHPVVKVERLDDEPLTAALTPVSVKLEIPEAVQAESSTSRRRVSASQ